MHLLANLSYLLPRSRKWDAVINLLGLATGLVACLVIIQYVDMNYIYDVLPTMRDQVFEFFAMS